MVQGQAGFWDVEHWLRELCDHGDSLEKLAATVGFEMFRADLVAALGPRDPAKGGRSSFDPVVKVRMLVLQAMHALSLEQTEYLVCDRLSWMRFLRSGPWRWRAGREHGLRDFREALIAVGALDGLFARLDRAITGAGYLAMSGQIVDATLLAAPRQRNTDAEKAAIKAGRSGGRDLARQAGQDAPEGRGCALDDESLQGQVSADGKRQIDIAIPAFGYKSHISIDRRHGIIRRHEVTDAAAHDGARLREGLIDPSNTASHVWADSAYRSAENERFLYSIGKVSRIHCKKPKGRAMAKRTARSNAAKSSIRAAVEHPFAHQKGVMGLLIRTIGLARAEATVILANIAYNMKRWCWLDRRSASA